MAAEKYRKEIETFVKSEDNVFEFKLKKVKDNEVLITIMDSVDLKIVVVSDGKFKVTCDDSGLQDKVNAFCKSSRSITDVLEKATSEFGQDEGDDEGDDEGEVPDFLEEAEEPIVIPKKQEASNAPNATQIMALAEDLGVKNHPNQAAVQHLLKTYLSIQKSDTMKDNYTVELVDKNLFLWHVKLYFGREGNVDLKKLKDKQFLEQYESEKTLSDELQKYARTKGQDYVLFEVKYHKNHPFQPPFVRVLTPRFVMYTGHITVGGSICFEFLTNNGWSPASSMETIIVQIRHALIEGKARIDFGNQNQYTYEEAKEAFLRMANKYSFNIDGLV